MGNIDVMTCDICGREIEKQKGYCELVFRVRIAGKMKRPLGGTIGDVCLGCRSDFLIWWAERLRLLKETQP